MMREITRAKNSGFCFGVNKAMDIAEEAIRNKGEGKLYTCGPLIHNARVTGE